MIEILSPQSYRLATRPGQDKPVKKGGLRRLGADWLRMRPQHGRAMFEASKPKSTASLVGNMITLTYHATVRKVRQTHGNALVSILLSITQGITQGILFIAAFYAIFAITGQRAAAIRGDFMLYLVTGVFSYLTHITAVRNIMQSEKATSPMMQHAPMNTLIALLSAAFAALYINLLSLGAILLILHTLFTPLELHYWPGALLMFILAWGSGVAIGMVFYALNPWMPDVISMIQMIYIRANMIASGKMFVANMLPTSLIAFFDWNPLFHIIDQMRGFSFVNYFPHYTNWQYPLYATLVLLLLGMMGEAYTRKHISASWDAKR